MLDDLKYIHGRDTKDALGIVEKQWQQLGYNYSQDPKTYKGVQNVVVAGMGGSALAASVLYSWPKLSIPLQVIRDYEIPDYVGSGTLFIASSYSGNTEETLSATEQAAQKNALIVVITAGGELAKMAAEKGYPLYQIPSGLQPRMAVLYNLAALVQILEPTGLIGSGKIFELRAAGEWLSQQTASWRPDVAVKDNQAKQIAQELMGKSVVVYSGPLLSPAAYKWKIDFNENAKQIAWCNQLPEFNHNEILGWTQQPVQKPYGVVDLRSNLEHKRVQKRFEVTDRLLSGKRPAPIVITAYGESLLQQLLWVITLGDFVSVYLALLNGIDPTPVDLIEKFKKALTE